MKPSAARAASAPPERTPFNMELVLASASPRRREILETLGYEFVIRPADVDEQIDNSLSPAKIAESLALQKATAVKADNNEVVLGADTIVVYGDKILGKPTDHENAKQMLRMLSGKTHKVYTGVCLADKNGVLNNFSVCTEVTFYELSDDEINAYVLTGDPLDKAGSYGIQGRGAYLVRGINGDYHNVVGLPAATVARALKKANVLPGK